MTTLRFASSASALLRGAETLFVLAPRKTLLTRSFAPPIPAAHVRLLRRLARATEPGDLGRSTHTLCESPPERLLAGVLPDRVSRSCCPARTESLWRLARTALSAPKGKTAVLVVVDREDHAFAAALAVARAVPKLSLRSKVGRGRVEVLVVTRSGEVVRPDARLRATADAAREAARLVDTPPTELDPAALAREGRRLLRGLPHVTTRVLVGDALLRAGLRGVHAVGRCAQSPPRVLLADYAPPRAAGPAIALVGKGITYDTGGLHLKPRGGMETMKADMGGAAATLGAFVSLVRSGFRGRLHLVLCLAENAIGPAAYKPDDVLTMHSGKTVEINNTDAEGRLLLADGVSYAARVCKAKTILDAATLTGAQLVATGVVHAAVVANEAALERRLVEAGLHTGDVVHPLPFAPELYKREFESPLADMRNSVKNRSNAQSSCAAQFVFWHVEDLDVRWGHVDLAGPAFRDDRATGFGVALLAETARSLLD